MANLPARLPNGDIKVPATAEGPKGVIGDGARVISREDEQYALWDQYLTRRDS